MRHVLASVALLAITGTALAEQPPKREKIENAADAPDKLICRRFQKTGSLAGFTRECHTKHEWDQARDEMRSAAGSNSCRAAADGGSCS